MKTHPHSQLSAEKLRKLSILTPSICHVNGLPLDIKINTLSSAYEQFGNIDKIILKRNNRRKKATLVFDTKESADNAICCSNNKPFVLVIIVFQ